MGKLGITQALSSYFLTYCIWKARGVVGGTQQGTHAWNGQGLASMWGLASPWRVGTSEEGATPCPLSSHFCADLCMKIEGKGAVCCPLVGVHAVCGGKRRGGGMTPETCWVSWPVVLGGSL